VRGQSAGVGAHRQHSGEAALCSVGQAGGERDRRLCQECQGFGHGGLCPVGGEELNKIMTV